MDPAPNHHHAMSDDTDLRRTWVGHRPVDHGQTRVGLRRVGTVVGALLVLVVGLSGAGLGPAAALPTQEGAEVVLTFEDYPARISGTSAARPVADAYADRGITFSAGVVALLYNNDSIPARPELPRSGETVITTCYAAEFCSNLIEMTFDPAVERVSAWIGSEPAIVGTADAVMEAFDATGTLLVRETVTLRESGTINTPIAVDDARGRIERAVIRWADSEPSRSSMVVDDVGFTPFVAVERLVLDPPAVELTVSESSVAADVRVLNEGNVPLFRLIPLLVDENGEPLPPSPPGWPISVTGMVPDEDCLTQLQPGGSCPVVIEVDAVVPVEDVTAVSFGLAVRAARQGLQAVVPVEVTIEPTATEDPTTDDPGDETTDTTEGGQAPTTLDDDEGDSDTDDGLIVLLVIIGVLLIGLLLIIGVLLIVGRVLRAVVRRLRQNGTIVPSPPPPTPPVDPASRKGRRPRSPPTVSATYDPGSQTVDDGGGTRPVLVASLQSSTAATVIIDHEEGTPS